MPTQNRFPILPDVNRSVVSEFDVSGPKRVFQTMLDKVRRSFFLDLFWIEQDCGINLNRLNASEDL